MDDHMWYSVRDYGEYELVPRFRVESKEHKNITECPSYEEMRDYCKVLTLIGKYAGFSPVKPSDYLDSE